MGRDSDWVGAASKRQILIIRIDGYINHDEAYLFVEIFWTDSQDLSLQDTLACSFK